MQVQSRPFLRLAQANMDLLLQFSTSAEVRTQATAEVNQLLQQATESAVRLMKSGAYAELVQGMLKNYTEFLTECNRGTVALVGQGQAALLQQATQVQEVAAEAVDAVADAVPVRRSRQAG